MTKKTVQGKRWYDRHPKLRDSLEAFQSMGQRQREPIVKGAMALIQVHMPDVFDRFALDFPLDMHKRRWYDKDPFLWLLFNGLSVAESRLLDEMTEYLSGSRTSPPRKSAKPPHRAPRKRNGE